MKTQVNHNSIEVYHSEIKGDKESSQDKLIYLALLQIGKPATMRMIQRHLKDRRIELEVNVMSRSMANLKEGKGEFKIYWVVDGECEVTKRKAGFFSTENPAKVNKYNQVTLF